jgi:hypothetical protein
MIRQGFALAGHTDTQLIRGIVFKVVGAFFRRSHGRCAGGAVS